MSAAADNIAEDFNPPGLDEYRAVAARRRAAAFAAPFDLICGLRLTPMSPGSYSRLYATNNAFLFQRPPTASDVRDYLWFHSPHFTADPHCQAAAKAISDAQFAEALRPSARMRTRACLRSSRFRSALTLSWGAKRLDHFVTELRESAAETFADAGQGSGPRLGATLEAQFIDLFSREYPNWSEEKISGYPLRRLFQLIRVIRCAHAGAHYVEQDPGEDAIMAAALADDIAAACAAQDRSPANTPAADLSALNSELSTAPAAGAS